MNTYTEGYQLAENDVTRFGTLHALDKVELFQGEFKQGYEERIFQPVLTSK